MSNMSYTLHVKGNVVVREGGSCADDWRRSTPLVACNQSCGPSSARKTVATRTNT